jgi:transposase InsO family protein
MNSHKNARTTPYSRGVLVDRVCKLGHPPRRVAGELGVSVRTVHKWLARYRAQGAAGLADRPSCAHRLPHRTPEDRVNLIEQLRLIHRLTGRQVADRLGMPPSTVAAVLKRLKLNRLKLLEPKLPIQRYEKAKPGELIHLDIKKLGRIGRPGHRVTGDRSARSRGIGWEYVHVCIDDHSRLAYVEVLPTERSQAAIGFLKRACTWFERHGVTVRRVMTDNGSCYVSKAFGRRCRRLHIHHQRTRPYTPKTNGKAERFIQTLLREWAYGRAYAHSRERTAHLTRWLRYYNRGRPHGGIGFQPPWSRIRSGMNNPLENHS